MAIPATWRASSRRLPPVTAANSSSGGAPARHQRRDRRNAACSAPIGQDQRGLRVRDRRRHQLRERGKARLVSAGSGWLHDRADDHHAPNGPRRGIGVQPMSGRLARGRRKRTARRNRHSCRSGPDGPCRKRAWSRSSHQRQPVPAAGRRPPPRRRRWRPCRRNSRAKVRVSAEAAARPPR